MEQLKRVKINGTEYSISGDSVFIRYSAYADGTDFTEEWSEGKKYLGVATGQSAPDDKSEYVWSLVGYTITAKDLQRIVNDVLDSVKFKEFETRLARLENLVLTLDAPTIKIEEDKPDEPTGYYIAFSNDAVFQIEDKSAYVEIDGIRTSVRGGEPYYCKNCKIAGEYYYNLSYSGDCDIDSDASYMTDGCLEDFNTAIIKLNGNVTITNFEEK